MGNLYYSVIDVTDYGPFVTRVILALPREIRPGEAGPEHFSVFVRLRDKQGDTIRLPKDFIHRDVFVPSEGYRPVTKVYPCSKDGERTDGASRFLALEMPLKTPFCE